MKALLPLICIGAALLAGCAQVDPLRGAVGSYRNYTEIKGTIEDGRYKSPDTNFVCKVPDLIKPGAIIKDSVNRKEGTGAVAFADDFGLRFMARWYVVPDQVAAMPEQMLLERVAASLRDMDGKTMSGPVFGEVEPFEAGKSPLFYIVAADAAGVKTYVPPKQRVGKTKEMMTMHVIRSHMIFLRPGWIYVLTIDTMAEFGTEKASSIGAGQVATAKSKLQNILADFEFTGGVR